MKKNLLIFIFFSIALNAYAQQPVIKVFAFEQENYPGTKPSAGTKDENGNPIKKAADSKNYFIFLSFKKTYSVTPIQVFIHGQAFKIENVITRQTPVEYTVNSIPGKPGKKILVPKTSNKVVEIQLSEISLQEKKTAYVQQLASTNDVVITYKWNNKKYFAKEKKMQKMEPVYHE